MQAATLYAHAIYLDRCQAVLHNAVLTARTSPYWQPKLRDSGVISLSTSCSCCFLLFDVRDAASMAAPCAIASSGWIECLSGCWKSSWSSCCTLGMRELPPTISTVSICVPLKMLRRWQQMHG